MILALRVVASVMLTGPIIGVGFIAWLQSDFDKETAQLLGIFAAISAIVLCAIWIR